MPNRKNLLLLIVTLAIIAASYITNGTFSSGSKDLEIASIAVEDSLSGSPARTTEQIAEFWMERYQRDPRDFISLTQFGAALLRLGRETGAVNTYQRAEATFRKALEIHPGDEAAMAYLAAALFVMHDFQGALELAGRIYSFDPRASQALATLGDAHLELGNYEEAKKAYLRLFEKYPSPPVYSRVARLAWLQGDPDQAITLMLRAVDEARDLGLTGESIAWYHLQIGEMYFNTGDLEAAEKHYIELLSHFENYYLGLAGLGKVRASQENYREAIQYYERAVTILPQPDLLAYLGDLYTLTGQAGLAQRQYETVEYIGKLAAINEQVYNRQLANFYSDHGMNLPEALELAESELAVRKDVYGYDAAAWAYYQNGMLKQAWEMMEQAMVLGTREAKFYYHAARIALAQGHEEKARVLLSEALSINSHFDPLHAPIARSILADLKEGW